MKNSTKYVGLDVSKDKIAVAIADEGRGETRFWGTINHTKEDVGKLMNRLKQEEMALDVCYEAGPTGYMLYRWLLEMGISCIVVAPSLIPKRSGDQVKTDKRDAVRLAQLHRAGELVPIYIPTPEDEAFRDLVRAREDAVQDLNRHWQRLGKFLLRHHRYAPNGLRPGTVHYENWLDSLRFPLSSLRVTFEEYRATISETKARMKRYEQEIQEQADSGPQAPLIQALQSLRGIALISAATLASEIGNIARFPHPRYLMSYSGLVPSEHSTGKSRRQGGITRAGNSHIRRILVEIAWNYRHAPAVRKTMRKRMEALPAAIQSISWEAQNRLNKKYKGMMYRGKQAGVTITAVARELLGFVWAVAQEVEKGRATAATTA